MTWVYLDNKLNLILEVCCMPPTAMLLSDPFLALPHLRSVIQELYFLSSPDPSFWLCSVDAGFWLTTGGWKEKRSKSVCFPPFPESCGSHSHGQSTQGLNSQLPLCRPGSRLRFCGPGGGNGFLILLISLLPLYLASQLFYHMCNQFLLL